MRELCHKHATTKTPQPHICASVLHGIYHSDEAAYLVCRQTISTIPLFTLSELRRALKNMPRGKCAAFIVVRSILGNALEWHVPVWLASIGLRKAFDRLEFTALFTALSDQGLDRAYIELFKLLYLDQSASVANSSFFAIKRGVK